MEMQQATEYLRRKFPEADVRVEPLDDDRVRATVQLPGKQPAWVDVERTALDAGVHMLWQAHRWK